MKRGGPHPARQELERLIRGELPREEALSVVRHLLTGCRECAKEARRYWRLGEWPPSIKADLMELAALVRPRRVHDEPGLI
ncbi:MAG TPA: hypothetical protein VGX68_23665 [Thermoanaerobaculia bacterium]|nr:hypothetical protein [Thermoanaerobaculia bacterium]